MRPQQIEIRELKFLLIDSYVILKNIHFMYKTNFIYFFFGGVEKRGRGVAKCR